MRLLRLNCKKFGNGPQRRQNFFQLNPIFPDNGQKDFDIYNVNYNHVLSSSLVVNDETRHQKLKEKLTQSIYLSPVYEKGYGQEKDEV